MSTIVNNYSQILFNFYNEQNNPKPVVPKKHVNVYIVWEELSSGKNNILPFEDIFFSKSNNT